MTDLRFEVLDITAEPYAAEPQLKVRLGVSEWTESRVHAIALRCQVRIEPQRRPYDEAEQNGLRALFGDRDRWKDTLRPFLWMHSNTTVQGFSGTTEVDLPLPCTYDFNVIGSRYLHALGQGDVPLVFMFSGTIFTRGAEGFGVEQVPWDREAHHGLRVETWRQLMDFYYPNTGWLRLDHEALDELADYRARHGLTSWEETVGHLLAHRDHLSPELSQ
jgi:hypothetical protein